MRGFREVELAAMGELKLTALASVDSKPHVDEEQDANESSANKLRQVLSLRQAGGAAMLWDQVIQAREENEALRAQLAHVAQEGHPANVLGIETTDVGCQFEDPKIANSVGGGRRSTATRSPGCSLPGMPSIVDGSVLQNSPACARASLIEVAGAGRFVVSAQQIPNEPGE